MKDFFAALDTIIESSKILKTRLVNIKDEIVKPESFYKGENFENFVEDVLFPQDRFILVRRTDTYERNAKRFSESTNDPDFVFRCVQTQREFSVEAKYRTELKNGQLAWAKMYQLERYKLIDETRMPVFIAVGLGGKSTKPAKLFLFPIKQVKYINLNMDIAEKYMIAPQALEYAKIWGMIK